MVFCDIKQAFVLVIFWSIAKSEPPSTDYGTPLGAPISNYQGSGSHYSAQNGYNNQNSYASQNGYSGQNGYSSQNGYSGQNGYSSHNGYGGQNGYNDYNNGGGGDHGHDHGDGEPKAYEFGYQVKDDYTGTNYNRQESSDGNQVRGEYRVALPDGRTQIVTYWADWQSGFHADVKYEGEAQYPDQYNKAGGGIQGAYSNGASNQYGAPAGGYNGYSGNAGAGATSNNLAGGHDNYNNYDSYNNGYNNKPPSNVYGPV